MLKESFTQRTKSPNDIGMPRRRAHHAHQYLSTTCDAHGKQMYTTRHLAALDFLLNIPMKNESTIHSKGLENVTRLQTLEQSDKNSRQESNTTGWEDSVKGGYNNSAGLPVNDTFELPERDWRGFSYKGLFKSLTEERASEHFFEKGFLYDPNSLDGGSGGIGSGDQSRRNIIVSTTINLADDSKTTIISSNSNPNSTPKKPALPSSLTLSDIRNIKKPTLLACLALSVEISTVALAVISFERLCLKNIVNKSNLKLAMSVALILAYKFNEPVNPMFKSKLEGLLDFFDRSWQLSRRQVLDAEFGGYVSLGFTMHVPQAHLHLVYGRLLRLISKSSREYLGAEMYEAYTHDRLMCENMRLQSKEKNVKSDKLRSGLGLGSGLRSNNSSNNHNSNDSNDNDDSNNNTTTSNHHHSGSNSGGGDREETSQLLEHEISSDSESSSNNGGSSSGSSSGSGSEEGGSGGSSSEYDHDHDRDRDIDNDDYEKDILGSSPSSTGGRGRKATLHNLLKTESGFHEMDANVTSKWYSYTPKVHSNNNNSSSSSSSSPKESRNTGTTASISASQKPVHIRREVSSPII